EGDKQEQGEEKTAEPVEEGVEKREKLSPEFSPPEQKWVGTFAVGKPQAEFKSIDAGLKSDQIGTLDSRSAKAQFEDREKESKPTIDAEKNPPQPSFKEVNRPRLLKTEKKENPEDMKVGPAKISNLKGEKETLASGGELETPARKPIIKRGKEIALQKEEMEVEVRQIAVQLEEIEDEEVETGERQKRATSASTGGKEEQFEIGIEPIYPDLDVWPLSEDNNLPSDESLLFYILKPDAEKGLELFLDLLGRETEDRGAYRNRCKFSLNELREEIKKDEEFYRFNPVIFEGDTEKENLDTVRDILEASGFRYVLLCDDRERINEEIIDELETEVSGGKYTRVRLKDLAELDLKHFARIVGGIKCISPSKFSNEELQIAIEQSGKNLNKLYNRVSIPGDELSSCADRYLHPEVEGIEGESREHHVMRSIAYRALKQISEIDKMASSEERIWKEDSAGITGVGAENEIKIEYDRGTKVADFYVSGQKEGTNGGEDIWVEVETLRNTNPPLEEVRKKLWGLKGVKKSIDELWLIFPYRKIFAYGSRQFQNFRNKILEDLVEVNQNPELRMFFADFYGQSLKYL
ncbi:hypothetical protein AKJ64_03895, partial [candidate division MSBL1 archaeon SCGC-AAA259E17]